MNTPPLIPFVTPMLLAPTYKDPISVPAGLGSLVMAKHTRV